MLSGGAGIYQPTCNLPKSKLATDFGWVRKLNALSYVHTTPDRIFRIFSQFRHSSSAILYIYIYFFFFRSNVWALCPTGYYLNGIRISGATHLYQIEEAKCCRPQNHPDAYEDCYNENVWGSFDNKGWSECKRDGYYMAGFYKSSCNHLYCLEEFRCCKMKAGNFFLLDSTH